MIHPSTFSIVAYDPIENAWGIAVASKFPAVGAVVPWARANAGAIATQSFANTSYGPLGLDMMERGLTAEMTLEKLLANDPEYSQRQVGIIDAQGNAVTFTGQSCYDWAGGLTGVNFAAQGNILVSQSVVEALADSFSSTSGNLPTRLWHALYAGDRAGGDRRGRQSAAIYVVKPKGGYGSYNDRWIDYRVDDHPDPVKRLGDLLDLHNLYFGKSPEEEKLLLGKDELLILQNIMNRLEYYQGPFSGVYDSCTREAFTAFIGNENFEERVNLELAVIDHPVYEFLINRFGNNK